MIGWTGKRSAGASFTSRPAFRDYGSCGPYGGVDSIAAEAAQGVLIRDFSRTSTSSSSSTNVNKEGKLSRCIEVRGSHQGPNSATLLPSHPTTTC
jgi:hypothetical protein